MIVSGVDQFTLVLQPSFYFEIYDWDNGVAETLINTFIRKSKIKEIFETYGVSDQRLPEGYTKGYNINNSDFYFSIAYHEDVPKMGVIVKTSAQFWAIYKDLYNKKYGEALNISKLFTIIESNLYTYRLSRVDLYCDFIDENINISKINKSISEGRTEVRYGKRIKIKENNKRK